MSQRDGRNHDENVLFVSHQLVYLFVGCQYLGDQETSVTVYFCNHICFNYYFDFISILLSKKRCACNVERLFKLWRLQQCVCMCVMYVWNCLLRQEKSKGKNMIVIPGDEIGNSRKSSTLDQ